MRELLKRLKTMDSHTRDETSRPMGPPLSQYYKLQSSGAALFLLFPNGNQTTKKEKAENNLPLESQQKDHGGELVISNVQNYGAQKWAWGNCKFFQVSVSPSKSHFGDFKLKSCEEYLIRGTFSINRKFGLKTK